MHRFGFSELLGFATGVLHGTGYHASTYVYNVFANLETFYVYSDVCEKSIVGDELANILCTVPFNAKTTFEGQIHWAPRNIFYMPLRKDNWLHNIQIEVRTKTGVLAPFADSVSAFFVLLIIHASFLDI